MNMTKLQEAFEYARTNQDLMIGVAIKLPNLEKPEVIINPVENFTEKLNYYRNAYDDDCKLKTCGNIQIVGVFSGDYADDIFCELMGWIC